jgi:putative membrane protein
VKYSAIAGGVVGIGLSIWLLESYGVARVFEVCAGAGWFGILALIAFHPLQMLASALAWRQIAEPGCTLIALRSYFVVRWIREGVNNLLPVAQVGGEVVAARLLCRQGLKPAPAVAGTIADLTLEIASQILFTALGLQLLVQSVGGGSIAHQVMFGLGAAVAAVACLVAALWLGFAGLMERMVLRIGRSVGLTRRQEIAGLDEAIRACFRDPGRVTAATLWHLISWLLGGIEICLALHFLNHDINLVDGLVIESIGQALKTLGFAVPGALGIQEGGYIVICRVFGLSPEVAIAVSLLKRVREAALGIPALVWWRQGEHGAQAPIMP